MSAPVFVPLYNLQDNACWPSLVRRQSIPDPLASAAATQESKVGLGIVKAACRILSDDRMLQVLWDPARGAWAFDYRGDSGRVRCQGTMSSWQVRRASSYHLALATIVDALTLGATLPVAQEFHERWRQLLARLDVLAGPPPYTEWRLALCADDQQATNAMMGCTDAAYFYAKSRAQNDGLVVEERQIPAAVTTCDPARCAILWTIVESAAPLLPPIPARPRRRLFTGDDFRP